MIELARHQILSNFLDAKFIFFATLILLCFLANGLIFSESYQNNMEDYRLIQRENNDQLSAASANLQRLSILEQRIQQPPSPLAFIATGGSDMLPNVIHQNAFNRYEINYEHRVDDRIPLLPALDWSFIIGTLFSLLAVLVSYDTVSGEKRDGTLRQVLSNPISKLSLFISKYIGLLASMLFCLFLGIILNLTIFIFLDGPPVNSETLWFIGWAVLLSILYISFFLVSGLAVSSLTKNPSISLVVLLVLWVVLVLALPGLGRLVAEQVVDLPTQADVNAERAKATAELDDSAPDAAHFVSQDPFDPGMALRAKLWLDRNDIYMRYNYGFTEMQIRQALNAKYYGYLSPTASFAHSLQQLSSTGVEGFKALHENCKQYRSLFYQFIVNSDAKDSSTPHLVYGARGFYDGGVFSSMSVQVGSIPRATDMWTRDGLPHDTSFPTIPLIMLLFSNFYMAVVAIFALLKYDPR